MSIGTYSELKTAVADFLMRDDLTAIVPSFIVLAEASISRKLRHYRMVTRAAISFTSGYVALPADWMETIRLSVDGYGPMTQLGPEDMMVKKENAQTGAPRYFTHEGTDLELWPVDATATGELRYFAKVPALSDSAATNWLLTLAPDAYLYGALIHSAPYLKDDARIAVWGSLYTDVMNSLQESSDAARFSGPLKMAPPRSAR